MQNELKIRISQRKFMQFKKNVPYARHYSPLLIRNSSSILTIHKARILIKNLEITFLDFKKWVKSIQTEGYNGARTVSAKVHAPRGFI